MWLAGGWSGAKDGPYAWGLCYNQELAPEKDYCKTDLLYPCAPGAGYYGRGAFPLYWYVCCLLSVYGLCRWHPHNWQSSEADVLKLLIFTVPDIWNSDFSTSVVRISAKHSWVVYWVFSINHKHIQEYTLGEILFGKVFYLNLGKLDKRRLWVKTGNNEVWTN